MIVPDFNWKEYRQSLTYQPSDCMVRVRTSDNALAWYDCYLNGATGEPHIYRYGKWEPVESISGFEAFEKLKTRKLFDTRTGQQVDTGVLVGQD